jgi:hypothetical protein
MCGRETEENADKNGLEEMERRKETKEGNDAMQGVAHARRSPFCLSYTRTGPLAHAAAATQTESPLRTYALPARRAAGPRIGRARPVRVSSKLATRRAL